MGAVALLSVIWLFFPTKGMTVFVSILTAGLIWEYYKLSFGEQSSLWLRGLFTLLCFSSYILPALFLMDFPMEIKGFLLTVYLFFVFSFWLLYFSFFRFPAVSKEVSFQKALSSEEVLNHSSVFGQKSIVEGLGLSLISLFYVVLPAVLFLRVFLYDDKDTVFLFLCIIFSGDIFAYLGGRVLKGKKWVPEVSPSKTWSGLCCGLCASAVVSGAGFYFKQDLNFFWYFLFGLFSFLVAQTGDLFVSLMKRRVNVKDSGFCLPGHGGLLDRLDGFLLAFPVMYLFLSCFSGCGF